MSSLNNHYLDKINNIISVLIENSIDFNVSHYDDHINVSIEGDDISPVKLIHNRFSYWPDNSRVNVCDNIELTYTIPKPQEES